MNTDPQEILQTILKSSPFIKSDLHKRLLRYLVTCHKKSKTPTELDIAKDVFQRDSDFNSADDTIVRVNIYKLRKKLDTYYTKEGKHDAVRLTIPKGHYNIEISKKSSNPGVRARRSIGIAVSSSILAVLLAVLLLIQHFKAGVPAGSDDFSTVLTTDSRIWDDFFSNSLPYDVIIGDYYIFEEYCPALEKRRRIMDYAINTEKEFYQFREQIPNEDYNVLPIGELPHHSIYNIKDLSKVFFTNKKDYEIKMSSSFNLDETVKHNIVYLGDFKSLRILEGFITNENIIFRYTAGFSGELFILNANGDTIKSFDNSFVDLRNESKSIDYCMIFKTKGANQENYLFIVGFGYISQLETLHILSNADRIKEFEDKIRRINGSVPDSFLAVLEISGLYLTPYYTELSYFKAFPD